MIDMSNTSWRGMIGGVALAGLLAVACAPDAARQPEELPPAVRAPDFVWNADTCHEAPHACSELETCWRSGFGSRFVCQLAGSGREGDACENLSDVPDCAAGLGCLVTGASPGRCTRYCDAEDRPCPDGETCRRYHIIGAGVSLGFCAP